MIVLQVEYPPSVNKIFRAVPGRGVIKSKEYRLWLEKNLWIICGQTKEKIKGKFTVRFEASRPDKRRRDLDNILKPLLDLIVQSHIIEDDSLCEELNAKWIAHGTGVTIFLQPLQGSEAEILPIKGKLSDEASSRKAA